MIAGIAKDVASILETGHVVGGLFWLMASWACGRAYQLSSDFMAENFWRSFPTLNAAAKGFFWMTCRCLNGYECEFCHYEHEKRKRKNKKNKKKKAEAQPGEVAHLKPSLTKLFRDCQAGDPMDDFFNEGAGLPEPYVLLLFWVCVNGV